MKPETTISEITCEGPIPSQVLSLYRLSFPPEERRPWTNVEEIAAFMSSHPQMHLRVIKSDGAFAGFMVYWHLSPLVHYVEHLATLPEMRGNGLGAKLIESLTSILETHVVLEVEPPVDELTRRRVGFYRRLGFTLHDTIPYRQPPYCAGLPSVHLCLMTAPDIPQKRITSEIVPTLHSTIYGKRDY